MRRERREGERLYPRLCNTVVRNEREKAGGERNRMSFYGETRGGYLLFSNISLLCSGATKRGKQEIHQVRRKENLISLLSSPLSLFACVREREWDERGGEYMGWGISSFLSLAVC